MMHRLLVPLAGLALLSAACDTTTKSDDDTAAEDTGRADTTSQPDTLDEDIAEDTAGDTAVTCADADNRCIDTARRIACIDGEQVVESCTDGDVCWEGECAPVVCEAGKIDSCTAEGQYVGCNTAGTEHGTFACDPASLTCVDGACIPRICDEGETRCQDDDQVLVCNEAGTAFVPGSRCTDVDAKRVCDDGQCKPICEAITKTSSYIGCNYWAVDLDNYTSDDPRYRADEQPFAVVVSNATGTLPARVTVWDAEAEVNGAPLVEEFLLQPGELQAVTLPPGCYDSRPSCAASKIINNSTRAAAAFHIKSDVPITAYQFNPLENVGVFSNDASLLLPQPSLGLRYRIMTRRHQFDSSPAFMTIVATEPEPTNVTVTVTERTEGKTLPDGTVVIEPIEAGGTATFTLEQYEVLNIASAWQSDLTGSEVIADQRVAVFAGVECVDVPETNPRTQACDHIEQQMYPIGAWGTEYHAVKTAPYRRNPLVEGGEPRKSGERDFWRVLARQDNTVVTTIPDQTEGAVTLQAGEWFEFPSAQDFEISATRPILVGQFMPGVQDPLDPALGQPGDNGDPTFILGVPVLQYRTSYVFLVPSFYIYDFVSIIAPVGATVMLDGVEVAASEFVPFGDGEYAAAKIIVEDGVHTVESTQPTGVFVYGIDPSVSYGYPAGLDLQNIFE